MIGRIYCIKNNIDSDCYVGSTKNRLCLRWAIHKNEMKLHPNRKLYQKIRELGLSNFRIELVEEMEYQSKVELKQREEAHRKTLNATLNTYRCNRD